MTTNFKQSGTQSILGVEVPIIDSTDDKEIFKNYRETQDAIKQLQERLNALKPLLTQVVESNGGKFEDDGYLAQMIETKPTKVLKKKDEVLNFVPKKYHWNMLRDMVKSPYLKVALAPKDKIVEVKLEELA